MLVLFKDHCSLGYLSKSRLLAGQDTTSDRFFLGHGEEILLHTLTCNYIVKTGFRTTTTHLMDPLTYTYHIHIPHTLWTHSYSPYFESKVPFWRERNFKVKRGPSSWIPTFFSLLKIYLQRQKLNSWVHSNSFSMAKLTGLVTSDEVHTDKKV